MRKIFALALAAVSLGLLAFIKPSKEETKIKISTNFGDITVKLYNETPNHKNNFIKLAKEGILNETLFHRVIKGFMIQGGDIDSKGAKPGKRLGNGSLGYTVPAEFNEKFYHKKRALAAARTPDQMNPQKASSSCQFYIVQGKTFTDEELTMMVKRKNGAVKAKFTQELLQTEQYKTYRDRMEVSRKNKDLEEYQKVVKEFSDLIDAEFAEEPQFNMSKAQINDYKTLGGTPQLDGEYTVFGEVIEGLDVIDKIAEQKCDQNNRPVEDIKMTVSIIE